MVAGCLVFGRVVSAAGRDIVRMTKWRARRIAIRSARDAYESGLLARRWNIEGPDPREPEGGFMTGAPQYLAVWRIGQRYGFEQGRAGNPEAPISAEVLAEAERVAKLSDREVRLL